MNAPRMTLRLYVAGDGPNSSRAKTNLLRIRQNRLPESTIEVVDILDEPLRCLNEGVRLSPTLVRIAPEPKVYIAGDLGDMGEILSLLGVPEENKE